MILTDLNSLMDKYLTWKYLLFSISAIFRGEFIDRSRLPSFEYEKQELPLELFDIKGFSFNISQV